LHFSGHAKTKEEIKQENLKLKKAKAISLSNAEIDEVYSKGDALVMENERYLAEYLHV
jgi:uncharacterized protein YdaT